MSAPVLRAGPGAPRARPPERSGARRGGERRRGGLRGVEPLGFELMDLSSLLQGATHVFPVAAQDCGRMRRDREFRVYVDKFVGLSQRQALKRARAQTGGLSVPPGITLEQELGTEYRWLSTVSALR